MIARSDGALIARRLLDQIVDPVDALAELRRRFSRSIDAVVRDLFHRHALDGEHRSAGPLEHVDHLLQRRRRRVDHVVARMTANGSSPTMVSVTSTAWPRPSGSPWRT